MNDGRNALAEHEFERLSEFFDQTHWMYLGSRVRASLDGFRPDVIATVGAALGYMLHDSDSAEERPGYGPFGPIWSFDGQVSALPFASIPPEMSEVWREIADGTKSAAARARLHDLLWVAKVDGAWRHGREAVLAYVELAGDDWLTLGEDELDDGTGIRAWSTHQRAECLRRAIQIARELNDDSLIEGVTKALLACGDEAVERDGFLAAAFEILRALTAHARPSVRGQTNALLQRAKAKYGTTAHNFNEICELAVMLADSAGARRLIRLEQVDRWMDQAAQSDGIVRLVELHKASDLVRQHGLTERLNGIRSELSRVDVNSLGMSSISVPFEVPREELDEYVRQFIVPGDWRETLARFALAGGPPSGVYAENLAAVAEQNARSPLLGLVSRMTVDDEGRPISTPSTPEERTKADLIRQELFGMSWWGEIGAMILSSTFSPDSVPTEEDLAKYFESDFIPIDLAVKIAHAHALYFRGAYDDCVHVLVPRVEALVRNLCKAADVPIAREVFGAESGGVAPLGTLLHELRIERSWSRYLVNALTEPTGMNLRNRVSHGLIGDAGQVEATILIHIVNFLRLLRISAPEPPSPPESGP